MAVFQSLTVTEVAGSQNIADNTSRVNIKWISTQTGESWNGYKKTAYYYVSINGGAEVSYPVTYTLPQTSTVTIVDTTITVKHRNDGTGVVSVRTYMETGISAGTVQKSQSITLATIPRVSVPTLSASSIDIGKAITIYTNRQSSSFTHHLYYSVNGGAEVGVTAGIGDSITWTVPYDLMSKIPNSREMTLTFRVYTFSGDKNIGSNTISLKAYVPTNANTIPIMSLKELKPISTLPSPFDTLFIQGKSRVRAEDFSAEGRYGSSITSCSISVEGESYGSADNFTSEYLSGYGTVAVTISATDSRGLTNSITEYIDVIAYSNPKIMAVEDEDDIICKRCDNKGNIADSGTYLKVKARRSYSKVVSSEVQKNFCSIAVRFKPSGGAYSEWYTILDKEDLTTNAIDSNPLLGGALAVDSSYEVQVCAKDDMGAESYATFYIPTDKIDSHEGKGFLALGKYSEKEGFECAWKAEFYEDVTIRGNKVTDFIIEEGTDGIWSYRKWASGYAECWGSKLYTRTFNSTWGSLYISEAIPAIAYPFPFSERPTEVASLRTETYACWIYSESAGRGMNTTTQTATYGVLRPKEAEGECNVYIDIIVKGRWK